MINFSDRALSPSESRAARNYLGLSQAQAAAKSDLQLHKIKRFESENYLPEAEFTDSLREFYEGEGYNFRDENAPGAKAKARGDVFPAGVIGETGAEPSETTGFTHENQGKLPRPQSTNLQFMRISPSLSSDQIDRCFDHIEHNEEAVTEGMKLPVKVGFLSSMPSDISQAQAVAQIRRLAENGLLYARLMGRELVALPKEGGEAETIGDLLSIAVADMHRAVVHGDKEAHARHKGRAAPTEVLQALVG
jgi:DNA-binding XRE family transcriptional regulator